MKLLFLAPQPFFQERGTPIAVRLALEVLANRVRNDGSIEHQIDLVTYHEGREISIPGVKVRRISAPSWLSNIGPGVSIKKLLCDVIFLFTVLSIVWQNRAERYDLVHAVEESVFIAWLLKKIYGIPYIYDMDSSLALQLTEKWYLLRPLLPALEFFERIAVRGSLAVVPVCDALARIAERHGAADLEILYDISLLKKEERPIKENLREALHLPPTCPLVVYIGNLESYQGIDLLIDSFEAVCSRNSSAVLIVIGGIEKHIDYYKGKSKQLGIDRRVFLIGPRPVESLSHYIMQADILVSPRTKGNNTPMKIYTYLHAGKGIVATNIVSHTQVLSPKVAELCSPNKESFAIGILRLLEDPQHCCALSMEARKFAEANFTFEIFSGRLNELYDRVSRRIEGDHQPSIEVSAGNEV